MFPILPAGSPAVATTSLPAFVVAHDGLYLRKQSLLGLSQTKVDGIEHLPVEKEFVEYALPKVPADLMARIVGFFRSVYRRQATEALVLLLWADAGFDCFVPAQKVSPVSVSHTLDETELPAGSRVIGSIHSHGAFGAWASSIDAADEAQFDGLHVVVGKFDRARPTYSVALAVDGQRFDIPTNVVLERPRRLVEPPEDWLQQVKLLPPPRASRSKGKGTGSNGTMA
jgi:proteasome lid subunit RPN8/RPN11